MPKAKLLIVEDDKHLLMGLRDILEMDDYAVITAENGMDALNILEQEHELLPDLIVSDIMMPHMDGLELLKEVRQRSAWLAIPFIFLTARDEKQDIHQGKYLGVDEYLVKPFDVDDLRVAVESRLKRHRAIMEAHNDEVSDIKRGILRVLNHEFRTPLTLVVAYSDMLNEQSIEGLSHTQLLEFLRGVNSGAQRLRRLIENFIFLVEIDNGDAEQMFGWRRREIPASHYPEIVRYALNGVYNKVSGQEIAVDIADGLPAIQGDFEFLASAIRELTINAVKFSPPQSPIRIRMRSDGHYLCISVRDQGRGIPVAEYEKIWQPFYQINRELYEDQGSGTGLAIVNGVVNMHNGTRHVESTLDEGSIFTLCLPVKP